MLLVDKNPIGLPQDLLDLRERVGDGLLAALPGDVGRDEVSLQGAGPEEGDPGYYVRHPPRPETPLQRHLPRRFELEEPGGLPAPYKAVGGFVVGRQAEGLDLTAQPLRDHAGGLVQRCVGLQAEQV